MHPTANQQIVRITSAFATAAALLVAVLLPLGHYYFGYRYHSGELAAAAKLEAHLVSQIVGRNPTMWRFETLRIKELLSISINSAYAERRRALSDSGYTVAEVMTADGLPEFPILRRTAPLYDAGRIVGRVEIERSLRPLLRQTGLVALFTVGLGLGVFFVLRILPLRALTRALDNISYLANHDPLTDLPNRTVFADRLRQAQRQADRDGADVSVLCLDLDHFKDVNDTLGHHAGDRLLQQTAERLRTCLRDVDTLARMGGDEFAVVQVDARGPEGAAALACRIVEALTQPFDLDGHDAIVNTSIGIAFYPDDGADPETLLRNADTALYRAKAEGRGLYMFFEEAMNVELQARKALERDLRQALVEGQFELHYQPQMDLAHARIVGVEALLRWPHPERGNVSPADFIPLAEETGLILPLGEWVLRTACREAVAWSDLSVAVNLSPTQFRQADLADTVAGILAETGLDPNRLELEITEGVLLQDTDATLKTLHALKRLGVRIAMDDFGTGYSSLSYLRRFPFDKIKVDRSFVSEIGRSAEAESILRAVVSLGGSLNMRANAEGIETEEQAVWLKREGCKEVQGFYFGRPMSAAEIDRLAAADEALAPL